MPFFDCNFVARCLFRLFGDTGGFDHAEFLPKSPIDCHGKPWATRGARVRKGVKESVGRAVVELPRDRDERAHRAAQDKEIKWPIFQRSCQVQRPLHFGREDASQLRGTLLVNERLAQDTGSVNHALDGPKPRLRSCDGVIEFLGDRNVGSEHTDFGAVCFHATDPLANPRMTFGMQRCFAARLPNNKPGVRTPPCFGRAWIRRCPGEAGLNKDTLPNLQRDQRRIQSAMPVGERPPTVTQSPDQIDPAWWLDSFDQQESPALFKQRVKNARRLDKVWCGVDDVIPEHQIVAVKLQALGSGWTRDIELPKAHSWQSALRG